MRNLLLSLFLLIGTASISQNVADPSNLSTDNLLKNPGFNGSPCYSSWQSETVEVACNAGEGYCWLNHNNRAADPSVKQTISGLTPGKEYEIIVGWRGGDHGPMHGVSGARNIFAIDLDGKEIKRLTTASNYMDWMVNDKPENEIDYGKITFMATSTSHTIKFRGEVGADGDVLISWVKVRPYETIAPQLLYSGSEGLRTNGEIDAGKTINLEVVFVDWSDKPVPAGTDNFDDLWGKITSNNELIKAFKTLGVTVNVTLHKKWSRMPKSFATYFPTGTGWKWEEYKTDGTSLLPVKTYPANTICIVVPNESVNAQDYTAVSGQHPTSFNGIRSTITLSPSIYTEHYTTLMHEIGHSFGSGELYPAKKPYLHEVAGYDLMGDVVYATSFLGYHQFRYGWITNDNMKFLSQKGTYKVDLKKLSLDNKGKNMIVIPDKSNPQKLWIIEIGQDVVSRDQFIEGKGNKLNTEGQRLILYTVEYPEVTNKRAIRLVPRVSFNLDHSNEKWLNDVSFIEGQSYTNKPGVPFSFTVNSKSSEGFQVTVSINEDIPYAVYAENLNSNNNKFKLVAQTDGNIGIYHVSTSNYFWDIKSKLFSGISERSVVVIRDGNIQLINASNNTVLKEIVIGAPADSRFGVSNEGKMQVIDADDKVWWTN